MTSRHLFSVPFVLAPTPPRNPAAMRPRFSCQALETPEMNPEYPPRQASSPCYCAADLRWKDTGSPHSLGQQPQQAGAQTADSGEPGDRPELRQSRSGRILRLLQPDLRTSLVGAGPSHLTYAEAREDRRRADRYRPSSRILAMVRVTPGIWWRGSAVGTRRAVRITFDDSPSLLNRLVRG